MSETEKHDRYRQRAGELRDYAEQANPLARDVLLGAASDYERFSAATSLVECDRIRRRLLCFEVGGLRIAAQQGR